MVIEKLIFFFLLLRWDFSIGKANSLPVYMTNVNEKQTHHHLIEIQKWPHFSETNTISNFLINKPGQSLSKICLRVFFIFNFVGLQKGRLLYFRIFFFFSLLKETTHLFESMGDYCGKTLRRLSTLIHFIWLINNRYILDWFAF